MGRRYYCDYCDKSFADNPTGRKTHLNGVAHLRNKKAHYDALRDEQEILLEDQGKRPCKMFLSTGDCRFGDRCQYSHLTNEDRARLAENVRQKEQQKASPANKTASQDLKTSLATWCKRRTDQVKTDSSVEKPSVFVPEYQLSDSLLGFASLPPSVLPPDRDAILNCDFPDWGS
ncbi:zinc finger matrin-type protein 5 [Aplysia californica]|uniref:Zinc finger matrin-type protein 5 n=1 Tax=Aplysia californica TaxID=6500 RepID=A0ABM0JK99_APLCA|nr:zinc finger matrin-type protein 5 [Aplysia californica]